MFAISTPFRRAFRLATDFVLPPTCLACRRRIGADGLCAGCWNRLRFLGNPCCVRCGIPFAHALEGGMHALCGACIAEPPDFDRARAALAYDDASRPLLLAFKHGDRLEGTALFSRWMAEAGREELQGADLLVPVPLHRWRLWRRRYNQAALLARALSRATGVPADPLLLRRVRPTAGQGGLGRVARLRNVTGAFRIAPGATVALAGRHVVLVDDVLTTGATAAVCARVLRRAGAARVDVVTLARVVRD